MNVLDLFSGIGGFSLGLERAGMRTVAFCEIDPFCRAVLQKHWPYVPCYDDVTTLTADRLAADGIGQFVADSTWDVCPQQAQGWTERKRVRQGRQSIDLICGGFPCQDISVAGKGAGIEGERSGLWKEYARIIGEVRPRYVIVENVAALLGRGLDRVLGDLAALGFNAEWHCIPASAVGAPHRRDRLWIVANASQQHVNRGGNAGTIGRNESANGGSIQYPAHYASISDGIRWGDASGQWWTEPNVGRVANGVPARVERLRSLGNAVVPQIPEIIGRAIIEAESNDHAL